MGLHALKYVSKKASLFIVGLSLLVGGSALTVNQLTHAEEGQAPNDQTILVSLKQPSNVSDKTKAQAVASAKEELTQEADNRGAEVVRSYENIPAVALKVNNETRAYIESNPLVAKVESRKLYKPNLAQVATRINSAPVYTAGYDGSGQAVAVIDSGVEATHSFFGGRVISEACYSYTDVANGVSSACPGGVDASTAPGAASPAACLTAGVNPLLCGHGTHVTGIAAGSGGPGGIHGVAPNASVIGMDIFFIVDDPAFCGAGPGQNPCISADNISELQGLDRVLELANDPSFTTPIASVNMSLGGGIEYTDRASCDADNPIIKDAIDTLRAQGIATVIASGNDGYDDGMSAPGCISSAVSVAATNDVDGADAGFCGGNPGTAVDTISCFSNTKTGMLDLLAPGAVTTSSLTGNTFGDESGTSMATPVVAGAWALLKEAKPAASVDTVLNTLKTTGTSVQRPSSGESFPLVNLGAAYDALNTPGVTVTQSGGNTIVTEGGATDSYNLVLDRAPTGQVDIAIDTDNAQATTDISSACFNITATGGCNAWNDPITVTVTADDDNVPEVNTNTVISHTVTSSDNAYDGISVASVNVTTQDNDSTCDIATDSDCDGVVNASEGSADANADGVADAQQSSVVTIENGAAGKIVSIVVSGVSAGCTPAFSSFRSVTEQSVGSNDQVDFPLGLNDFTITGCAAGDQVNVRVIYDTYYPGAHKFYKVVSNGSGGANVSDISSAVSFAAETLGGKKVTTVSYPITDGGSLDQDGQANGFIVDPSGVGVSQGAGISELQDTGISMLIATILGSGIMAAGLYVGIRSLRKSNHKLAFSSPKNK